MDNYQIFETKKFVKKFSKLAPREKEQIKEKLKDYVYPQICKAPHSGKNIKKLVGIYSEIWRYRISAFRLFYTIDEADKLILIINIERRKDAY